MSDDLLHRRDEDVLWLTLHRPERLNALNSSLGHALADALSEASVDESIRVVVLQGAGRAFCAGLDIADYLSGGDRSGIDRFSEIVLAIRSMPQTVVASVRGPAVGGGFALALAADLRIASATAAFKNGFIDIGVSGCELGSSVLLPRALGGALASELMLTGRALTADRARMVGFVTDVVPDEQLRAATERLVGELIAKSPIGLRRTKETVARHVDETDLSAVIMAELQIQYECMEHPDYAAALEPFARRRG